MAHTAIVLLAIGLLALYLVLCPRLNYALYRPLLFHPMPFIAGNSSPPQLVGVDGEDVFFTNNRGNKLHGWYFYNPDAKYTVLFSHGNGANVGAREDTVSVLLAAGTSVLIYDYAGYGNSEGVPSVERVCHDSVSAYDYLNKTRNVPAKKIILYGESLGCAVSTYLSTQRPSAGIILQSGFASLNRIATEIFPALALYPGQLLADPPLDNVAIVKRPHPPLLVVHGTDDDIVPFAHGQAVYEAAVEPKKFIELQGCGHNDISASMPGQYKHILSDWFTSLDRYHDHGRIADNTGIRTAPHHG
ncbi:MAG TPA: alpha/beta hydrolase [Planktothrix sp.]